MEVHCKYDALVDPEELKPFPRNPNKHSKAQIEQAAKIIQYQGWRNPVVVSKLSGCITTGHGRMLVAQQLKCKVPVVYQKYESKDQEWLHVISDNAIASQAELDLTLITEDVITLDNGTDLDLLGFEDFKLDASDKYDEEELDTVPAVPKKPKTKLGDLYQLGKHRLLCGDSTKVEDVERLMGDDKAELLFTSPPYSDLRTYGGDQDLSVEKLVKFIPLFFNYAEYQIINLGLKRQDHEIVEYWQDYIKEAKTCGYKFLSWGVWARPTAGGIGNQSAFFPITHEWIFTFGKEFKNINRCEERKSKTKGNVFNTRRKPDGTMTRSSIGREELLKQLESVIILGQEQDRKVVTLHPAVFPVDLPSKFIRSIAEKNKIIVDPFLGSGSTLIACESTDRVCYGVEIDPGYCDVIVERWETLTGDKAKHLKSL